MILLTIIPFQDRFQVSLEGGDWTLNRVVDLTHQLNPENGAARQPVTTSDEGPETSQIVGALKSERA